MEIAAIPTQIVENPAVAPKKKCAGTCENCRKKKLAMLSVQRSDGPNNTFFVSHINQNEMQGIEFETTSKKRTWKGCFRGTKDY